MYRYARVCSLVHYVWPPPLYVCEYIKDVTQGGCIAFVIYNAIKLVAESLNFFCRFGAYLKTFLWHYLWASGKCEILQYLKCGVIWSRMKYLVIIIFCGIQWKSNFEYG